MVTGCLALEVHRLHEEYRPVVRIAPDELSYTSSKSWSDIYGFRNGKPEMAKESPFYLNESARKGIVSAKREKHSLRRLMSRGFSDAALREQQPIIKGYVDLLMRRLRGESDQGKAVEITSWFNVSSWLTKLLELRCW